MDPALVGVNLAFAVAVVLTVQAWRRSRSRIPPVGAGGGVAVRVRVRPADAALEGRCVRRALTAAGFVPDGPDRWRRDGDGRARTAAPVPGDRAALVEVPPAEARAVFAGLLDALLSEGFEVSGERERRVRLRRGPERADLTADPT